MQVSLNGKPTTIDAQMSVAVLVTELAPETEGRGIAVAVNATVVPRSQWEQRTLKEGDRVEIVHAIQGG